MKRLLIITNVLWLTLFFLMAFRPQPSPEQRIKKPCTEVSFSYAGKPFEGIPASLATEMIANYRDNHWKKIRINDNNQYDSRWVWFSLEQIKQFIYEAETTTCPTCPNNKKDLGVRFYFIEYPDSNRMNTTYKKYFANVPKIYQKRHSLLMVPTLRRGDVHVDFNTRTGKFNCIDLPTFDMSPPTGKTPELEYGLMNRASMIPPPMPKDEDVPEGRRAKWGKYGDNLRMLADKL